MIGTLLSPMLTRRPLIAALALGFGGLASAAASATTLDVTSCADSGAGSLRQVVHDANSLDTVNLSPLTCSQISLTTGAIAITQDSLTVVGPGADKLTLYAATVDPTFTLRNVISHTGFGTLEIDDLTIAHGAVTGPTCGPSHAGGCICSGGNLTMKRSVVTNCKVSGALSEGVRGGGISAEGNILLEHSTVSGNQLLAQGFAYHFGGDVFGLGNIDVRYSAVTGNYAHGSGGGISDPSGYGIQETILSITHSTVSGNTVSGTTNLFRGGGGISFDGRVVRIDNSIISDNRTPATTPAQAAAYLPITPRA